MRTRIITYVAWLFSLVFRPYHLPLVGFITLFACTYLRVVPFIYKMYVLGMVYLFTVFLPRLCVWVYRKLGGWAPHQLRLREYRGVPYVLFILSYLAYLHIMVQSHMPPYMCGILISALLIQVVCVVINMWWKVSVHCAGSGGVIGALVAYSILFSFNPVWWLCLCILISGAVGSSRMWLRQHTLAQVVVGTLVGVVCGFAGVMYIL